MPLRPHPQGLTSPADWARDRVDPAIADFRADPTAMHRATAAAIAVYHLHERIFQYWTAVDPIRVHFARSETDFAEKLRSRSWDFKLLGDAADASKHHLLTRNPARRTFTTASSAFSIDAGAILLGPNGPPLLATIEAVMQLYKADYF